MPSYSRGSVVLVSFPFSDGAGVKPRPAVILNPFHPSCDYLIVGMTSRTSSLMPGEFILSDWHAAGLNVQTAVKRAIITLHEQKIFHAIGTLTAHDLAAVEAAVRFWMGI